MGLIFKKSFVVACVTVFLDFLFHYFLTHPMEVFSYFVIKFFLAFFVANWLFSSKFYKEKVSKRKFTIPFVGLLFSLLMSIYYRFWELGEAHVPFGARAEDILGIDRYNLILFSGAWWLGHSLFFVAGVLIANWMAIKEE